MNFSGVLTDVNNKPLNGVVGVSFALYKDAQGGAPLWVETQNVQPDKTGHYSVMLGSTLSQGLPSNLFASGAARWLGVQAQGQTEQRRVLLVAVPYALKALDAETIAGKPASAFALATPAGTSVAANPVHPSTTQNTSGGASPSISGGGKPGYIPEWFSTTKLGNSALFQSSAGNLGISTITPAQKLEIDLGNMLVRGANNFGKSGDTAYTYVGDTHHSIEAIYASGLAIGAYKVPQAIFIQDKTGNVGMAANLTVNGNLSATQWVSGVGFEIGSNPIAFGVYSKGNAFLGFAGNSTMTGSENTASGYEALFSNTTGSENTASGYKALFSNTTNYENTASGAYALYYNTGILNTADGYQALYDNTTGYYNTASGGDALKHNTTGYENTAVGMFALWTNTTGNDLTCIGYNCSPGADGLRNATAIGAHAVVGASNALVLGGTGKYAVKVGIGTTTPSNVLTIAQGAGHPLSDGWATYSSRRWKTNIQTLQGALGKVEQLRGVSYDLKESGKHEVGVIAEEVGAVVPEVVTWEKNGKDAQSVDYGCLTALLIEATKEQQALIHEQKEQIRAQQEQIVRLTRQVKTIQATLKANARSGSAVRTVKVEGTTVRQ